MIIASAESTAGSGIIFRRDLCRVFSKNLVKERARRHYEAGLRIAELSFAKPFNDLLPWGCIDNRPYLRCLHGFGLCLWRAGDPQTARKIFEKMLWLNPTDNQGARILLADVDAGKDWYQVCAEER